MIKRYRYLVLIWSFAIGCAGIKVVNPNDKNQNEGTKMLDLSGGEIKVVDTYSCTIVSQGKKSTAIGKTEEEARKEAIAKCQDRTVISFCKKCKSNLCEELKLAY